jgi:hypothetical protein
MKIYISTLLELAHEIVQEHLQMNKLASSTSPMCVADNLIDVQLPPIYLHNLSVCPDIRYLHVFLAV